MVDKFFDYARKRIRKKHSQTKHLLLSIGESRILYPVPHGPYYGLVIVMAQWHKLTSDQTEFLRLAEKVGHKTVVAYGADQAIAALESYLALKWYFDEKEQR